VEPISVMLVDDNPTFLGIVTRFLQQYDEIDVLEGVNGGAEAVTVAHRLRPDVVLIDLAMPKVSGMEAILRLRAAWPKMGIIALTLLDTNGYRQAALTAGADDFVAKDNLNAALMPAIRRVAETKSATSLSET
jgi:two-component system nitrate/nitrite response regulator NarL